MQFLQYTCRHRFHEGTKLAKINIFSKFFFWPKSIKGNARDILANSFLLKSNQIIEIMEINKGQMSPKWHFTFSRRDKVAKMHVVLWGQNTVRVPLSFSRRDKVERARAHMLANLCARNFFLFTKWHFVRVCIGRFCVFTKRQSAIGPLK